MINKTTTAFAALALAILSLAGCSSERRMTPIRWCVEEIKRKDLYEENGGRGLTYAFTQAEAPIEDYDRTFFVDVAYGDQYGEWYEDWICSISSKKGALTSLAESDVTAISCARLKRIML